MSDNVIFSSQGGVCRIRFARPEKLNAFTPQMYVRLGEILDEAEADDSIRVILMQGDGRAFSAGFDLTIEVADRPAAERREFLHGVANANRWKIWNSKKLVVAKAHGYCLAGAFELMLPADFCIASSDCVLGEPEVLFGAGPAFFMVPWITSPMVAKAILLRGRNFTGADAARWGVITEAVPPEALDAAVEELIEGLLKLPGTAVQMLKAGINRSYEARGMRASIDAWADTVLLLDHMVAPEAAAFRDSIEQRGVKHTVAGRHPPSRADAAEPSS